MKRIVSSRAAVPAALSAAYPPVRRGFFSRKPQPAAVPASPPEVLCDRRLRSRRGYVLRLLPWAQP